MAKLEEANLKTFSGMGNLGDYKLGPISVKDVKLRVHTLFTDYTMDLSPKAEKPSTFSLMNLIKPSATLYLGPTDFTGETAYKIDPIKKSISKADPKIFSKPTITDMIIKSGVIPIAILGIVGYFGYRVYKG